MKTWGKKDPHQRKSEQRDQKVQEKPIGIKKKKKGGPSGRSKNQETDAGVETNRNN